MPMEKKRLRGSNMGDAAFVKSFSENKNDLLMWGLYADSYKGMCVEYDIAKLPEPQNQKCLRHLFPVIYSDKRNQKLESYEMQRDTRNLKIAEAEENAVYSSEYFWLEDIMSLYLQKPKQWEAEKEWRIVVTYLQKLLDKDNVDPETSCPELYEINEQTIEFPCATRIFLGPRMPKHKVEHLRKIGDKIGAQVCKMVLSDDQYELKEERL